MNRKLCFCLGIFGLSCILLSGCQSTQAEPSAAEIGKKAAKIAVKAAIRQSPVAVIRGVSR